MVTKIYANAVAKYNEGKLLDAEKLRRLSDASFSDAVKMLADYGYGGGTVQETGYDVDAFISSETSKLIAYALESSPNEYLSRVLVLPYLYGNAKAYYNARLTGKENPAAIYRMPDGEVRDGIASGTYTALSEPMADALSRLDAEGAESPVDGKRIDTVLTAAMYAESLWCAKKSGSKRLRDYVTKQIDIANIFTALRARALGLGAEAATSLYIAGGTVSEEVLNGLLLAEDPLTVLRETAYEALAEGCEKADLPRMEARADELLAQVWESDAENMQSFAPYVRYFTAQKSEYRTVKMILTCLKNDARSEIAARLRHIGV